MVRMMRIAGDPMNSIPAEATAQAMERQNSYTYEEPLDCGHGKIFGPGNGRLPLPNML